MKKVLLLILVSLIYSCDKTEKKVELTVNEALNEAYKKNKTYVDSATERVALLAISRGISGDTLKLILTDYYTQTYVLDEVTIKDSERIVTSIAQKFHVSKPTIASLIYNFEYEMLTRDEIFESEMKKKQSDSGEF